MEKIIQIIAEELNVKFSQVENTVKLMTEVVKRLDQETVNKIIFE